MLARVVEVSQQRSRRRESSSRKVSDVPYAPRSQTVGRKNGFFRQAYPNKPALRLTGLHNNFYWTESRSHERDLSRASTQRLFERKVPLSRDHRRTKFPQYTVGRNEVPRDAQVPRSSASMCETASVHLSTGLE